jgi:polyketide cyclase/dehydrase/lipid transport protein
VKVVDRTFVVPAKPSVVFAYLTDPARATAWQSSLVQAHLDPPEPMRRGTRIRELRRFLGREIESTVDVTELEPDVVFAGVVHVPPAPWRFTYRLEEEDGATRVHVRLQGEAGGLLGLGGSVALRFAEQELAKDFATLTRLVGDES